MLSILFTHTPLKFFIQSFWRDEAFSYLLAKNNLSDILLLTAKDFNPPLYYLILHFWMKVFGASEISLRLISLICFCATLYILFLFLTNIFKIRAKWAFIYLSIFILNPLLNYYAFEARMYALLAFLSTLSFYLLLTKRRKSYLVVSSLGLITHYFMIFVIISQLVYIGLTSKKKDDILIFLKNFLIIFSFFAFWLLLIFVQKPPLGNNFWIDKPDLKTLVDLPAIIYSGYEKGVYFFTIPLIFISINILLIIGLALYQISKDKVLQKKTIFLLLMIWSFFPVITVFIISLLGKSIFLPRYLIYSNIGLLLLIIYALEQLNPKIKILLLTVLITFTLMYNVLQIIFRIKADIRTVINEIKRIAKTDDLLYVTQEFDFHPAQYYFHENKVFIFGKSYEEIPSYVGKILIKKKNVVNTLPNYPQRAFVLNEDLTYEVRSSSGCR